MDRIMYSVTYGLTYLIWLLPNRLRYVVADVLFFFTFYVFGYRKKVVQENIRLSFPEKTESERAKIVKDFYFNLVDVILETSIQIHFTKEEAMRSFRITNPEILAPFYEQKRSVVYASLHFANWEINASQCNWTPYPLLAVYKPLTNKSFEKYMNALRSHVGGIPIKMHDVFREVIKRSAQGQLFAVGLIADQAPMPDESHFWTIFLCQETSFFMGPEKMARKYNMPVVFPLISRKKRGQYEIEFKILSSDPKSEPEFEITKRYVQMLETTIRKDPSNWLWSHRRWKRKRDDHSTLQYIESTR